MSNVAEWSENLRYIRTADCDLPMKNLNCFLHVIMPLQNIDTSSLNILDLQNQICLRHHVPACRYESKQIIKTYALFNYLYLLSPVPHGLVGLPRARAYAITGQNIRSYMAGDPMWDRQLIVQMYPAAGYSWCYFPRSEILCILTIRIPSLRTILLRSY